MPRWEPNADERLREAALALFEERGYDNVTAADIAQRADLNRRSFFRYFPDKRDVLFAGSDALGRHVADAVRNTSGSSGHAAVEAMFAAFVEVGTVLLADLPGQRRRRALIATSADLRERERAKLASTADAVAEALAASAPSRGALLAAIAVDVFHAAFLEAVDEGTGAVGFSERLTRARSDATSLLGIAADEG